MKMTRVVLADDHPFLRAGVEAALIAGGIVVAASVENGAAAMEAVQRVDPDVVILDIRMAGMNGIEALTALRASEDNRPVVLFTAEIQDADLLAAMKAKVDGIVFKHGSGEELIKAVHLVASGQRSIESTVMDRAFDLALDSSKSNATDLLSPRERQIAEGVAVGKRNREIAESVGMTEGSIKVYLHRIYEKLGIDNRTELAVLMLNARKT